MSLPDRFWRRVTFAEDGCWEFNSLTRKGYGTSIQINGIRKPAHVWAWQDVNGPVPNGLVMDHLCRNRACVRPDHLRAVTSRENTLAPGSLALAKICAERTHCPHGHEYNAENTVVYGGRRRCRTCIKEQYRRSSRKATA